ncbi:MAG: LPS export ABC transporter periplasmic protein LptC [Dechloromonas sp.]|nr:LPS export ABC transporter periplasmic protein LptC [Dechloromonas sp.]
MKNWSGQIFPITLLALIAGLSFWLQASQAPTESGSTGSDDKTPDAYAENFQIRRHDDEGHLKYRLSASHLQHFPRDDSSEIRNPELIAYRKDAAPVMMTAGQAKVTAQGEKILLSESVRIVREGHTDKPALVAETSRLNIYPETGQADTDQPVHITQGAFSISGIGAHIDNNASTFELKSQVRGQYLAPRAQP